MSPSSWAARFWNTIPAGLAGSGQRSETNNMGILDIFGVGGISNVIDDILKMFPNAEQRAAAENKLTDLVGQVAAAQSATNTAEAATGKIFLAGWRPFIGWICGFGFLYS